MSIDKKEPIKKVNNYLKYSGMAFQMVGALLVGVFLGRWLDRKLDTPQPYFTALLALVFTGVSIYVALRDFLKK